MPQALDNIIVEAVPDTATYGVKVTWANGETTVNRFDHLLGKGIFATLANPAVFVQVRVGERGRSLEWPGEIDYCADALWFATHPADAPNGHSGRSVMRRSTRRPASMQFEGAKVAALQSDG